MSACLSACLSVCEVAHKGLVGFIYKGAVEGTFSEIMQMLPVSLDSLLLCCDGRVCTGPSSTTDPNSKEFIPPEYGRSRNLTEEEVEKVSRIDYTCVLISG